MMYFDPAFVISGLAELFSLILTVVGQVCKKKTMAIVGTVLSIIFAVVFLALLIVELRGDEPKPPMGTETSSSEMGTDVTEQTIKRMPKVVGCQKIDAESTLEEMGLWLTIEYQNNDEVTEGEVISQSIKEGTVIESGEPVTITISSGKEIIYVADVAGRTQEEAIDILGNQGFRVTICEEDDFYTEKGKVVRQSPGAGSSQIKDAMITIYVSKGKQPLTVIYDANGGTVDVTKATLYHGGIYGELPTPTRTGYEFNGWYTEKTGGTKVTSDTIVTENQILYAQWTVKQSELTFDANGGTVTALPKNIDYGAVYGTLPVPTRDYYNFKGWYTAKSGGSQVTNSTKMGTEDVTIYAQWEQKPLSSWVLSSKVPSSAKIVNTKWTYTRTQTTESTSSTKSGWTQTGTYWKKVGSDSIYYASFPTGFDTSNSIYTSFSQSPYSEYEKVNIKREVSNSWEGYVYWHWMYDVSYANSTTRAISNRSGWWDEYGNRGSGFNYKFFYAFTSKVNCSYLDNYYCCSQNLPSYYCHNILATTTNVGTPRFFRFEYYKSTYTDYQKIYKYRKVTTGIESTTKVTAGGEISNVQEWVQYREK